MPAWARDHNIWERAKKAALADHAEGDDNFYAVVTSIYKKMGGKVGGSTGSGDEVVRASAAEMVQQAAKEREKGENMSDKVNATGTSDLEVTVKFKPDDSREDIASRAIAAAEAKLKKPADIIHCRAHFSAAGDKLGASEPWKCGERVEFMWMPAGLHTICAGFRSGTIELTVQCDEQTAAAVQASLDAWRDERPKQEPFGCVEHREHEASVRVSASGGFKWAGDGVYLAAEPTTLGAENVNGKVHRSWSPSFTTDAEYDRAKEVRGSDGRVTLVFPEGVRGSRGNPARITGVDFCVGTLTNKPAFHAMSPVKSSEAVTAAGTSEGARKGWETKHAGGFGSENGVMLADVTGGRHASTVVYNNPMKMKHGKAVESFSSHFHTIHHENPEKAVNEAKEFLHSDAAQGAVNVGEVHPIRNGAYRLRAEVDGGDVHHFTFRKASHVVASGANEDTSIHAHCSHLLLSDVPDATAAEMAAYDECVDNGGSHTVAVTAIREARSSGKFRGHKPTDDHPVASEPPTLEAIYAAAKAEREQVKALAEEVKGPALTLEDVYRMRTVRATWSDAARKAALEARRAASGMSMDALEQAAHSASKNADFEEFGHAKAIEFHAAHAKLRKYRGWHGDDDKAADSRDAIRRHKAIAGDEHEFRSGSAPDYDTR